MRVKPKENMMLRYGLLEKCYVCLALNQVWETDGAKKDSDIVKLHRDNVSIQIHKSDFLTRFKTVCNVKSEVINE